MIPLLNPFNKHPLVKKENGYADDTGAFFPKIDGVVRVVAESNYADNFGFQWNKFDKTQIDRDHKNLSHSKDRFFAATNWGNTSLKDVNVLEAGSGAGRFSQIVLDYTEANLYSFDYSNAVVANFKNNGHHGDRFKLFQASIYEMPFADNSFDKVFCFGVLQHTPDVKKSVRCLIDKVRPGGEILVDFYPVKGWWSKVNAKYMLRPFTKKMSHEKLLRVIEKNVGWMMRLHFFFNRIGLGKLLNRFIPLCDIRTTVPYKTLSKTALKEWVILDTFDMFSPEHDHPQRIETVAKWFREYNVDVSFAGLVNYGPDFQVAVVRGIKK